MIQKLPGITRVTVVDHTGRAYERWNVGVSIDVQDDGKTIKLFLDDQPEPRVTKRKAFPARNFLKQRRRSS